MFWTIVTIMLITAIALVSYPILTQQTEATQLSHTSPMPAARVMTGLFIFLIPIAVISIYFNIGSPDAIIKVVPPDFVITNYKNENANTSGNKVNTVADVTTLFERLKLRLDENPEDGSGWKMMGLSYLHFKQYDQALKAYEKAAELLPGDQSIQQAIQRVKLEQGHSGGGESNRTVITAADGQQVDIGAMVARLEKKLETHPDNLPGWMMLGRSYTHLGQHQKAVSAYQNALRLEPDSQQIMAALSAAKQAAIEM